MYAQSLWIVDKGDFNTGGGRVLPWPCNADNDTVKLFCLPSPSSDRTVLCDRSTSYLIDEITRKSSVEYFGPLACLPLALSSLSPFNG